MAIARLLFGNGDSSAWLACNQLAPALPAASTTPLPTVLGQTSVQLVDSGRNQFQAALQFVAPGQINFLVPSNASVGEAQLSVMSQGLTSAAQPLAIQSQAPGLFTANANGSGVAAGFAVYVYPDGSQDAVPLFTFDSATKQYVFNSTPIPASGAEVYISLYGTGWRAITADSITPTVGGESVPVSYIGPQGIFEGLDQVNLGPLPVSLKQNPGVVNVVFTLVGAQANIVQLGVY